MRNRFDRQLAELNCDLIQMGNMIEHAIELAIQALNTMDEDKATAAIAYDEEIDAEEKEIENLCFKLLLQQQPVARDLRVISAALKMITDMERIGDHASDISEVTIHLAKTGYKGNMAHVQKMAAETTYMVVKSIEAYVEKDKEKAKEVICHDDIVDDLFCQARKDVIDMIRQNADLGEPATDLLMIAKYFERIGDHATNIAEWVIFSITGIHGKKAP
ncbi:MAG: phosphate signaling complex protein PhoU [Eubacterium sp.]|nr:phosphate signaling complex protein PhoU [Eubacterium sp.]